MAAAGGRVKSQTEKWTVTGSKHGWEKQNEQRELGTGAMMTI